MKHFPENIDQLQLNEDIRLLKQQIEDIEKQVNAFLSKIRSHIMNELIEVQELTVVYKKLQKEKKEKRHQQKKKGKNYQEPTSLQTIKPQQQETSISNKEEQAEKKRLYREAMLYVHPDKFSMQENAEDLATDITTKLIEIYQTGSLDELKAYHAHIFNGNVNLLIAENKVITNSNQHDYLIGEIQKLKQQLEELKKEQLYKVLTEYENPLTFLNELKEYYTDRVMKLRKRTRKANVNETNSQFRTYFKKLRN